MPIMNVSNRLYSNCRAFKNIEHKLFCVIMWCLMITWSPVKLKLNSWWSQESLKNVCTFFLILAAWSEKRNWLAFKKISAKTLKSTKWSKMVKIMAEIFALKIKFWSIFELGQGHGTANNLYPGFAKIVFYHFSKSFDILGNLVCTKPSWKVRNNPALRKSLINEFLWRCYKLLI